MPIFEYAGKNRVGESVSGEIMAGTSQEAVRYLRTQEFFVTRLHEKDNDLLKSGNEQGKHGWRPFSRGVRGQELLSFTQQLSTLIRSGVPLLECLDLLAAGATHPRLQQALPAIREQVASGKLLAQALSGHSAIFSKMYRNLVEVGESTGRLDESLTQLSLYLEKQARLRSKIFSSLAYPALLIVVAVSVLTFLLMWVVPLFAGLFREMGDSLPWLTQLVIGTAEGMKASALVLAVLFVLIPSGGWLMVKDPAVRKILDAALLRIPLVGPVLQKAAVVRFTRTLGSLVQRGVPLRQGLFVAEGVLGNKVLEQGIQESWKKVEHGVPLSQALHELGLFPPLMTQMIKVGESTGSLDSMLEKIADLFEQEVDRSIATMTALVEPAIIVVVGAVIAVVVIAMYLPIFSIGNVIT